jgi:hypothetical protein
MRLFALTPGSECWPVSHKIGNMLQIFERRKRRMTDDPCNYNATVLSESRCVVRLRYVDLVISIEVAVEVCCCFTVFSC